MTKYCLEMTEEQARTVIAALDFLIRMRIGQWEELARLTPPPPNGNIADYQAALDKAKDFLLQARDVVMPELQDMHSLDGSFGVYKFPGTERAFNILKAVRSCIAWHNNPKGGYEVIYDRPRAINVMEEMPKCEVVADDNKVVEDGNKNEIQG